MGYRTNQGIESYRQREREYLTVHVTPATLIGMDEREAGNGSRLRFSCQLRGHANAKGFRHSYSSNVGCTRTRETLELAPST